MPLPDSSVELVDTVKLVQKLVEEIAGREIKPLIFVDLEGNNLSRHGSIAIMQVLVPPTPTVYLIDVHVLGKKAFETQATKHGTLKEILESDQYAKFFFDVRNDSDALYHLYKISLRGVVDIQLLEFATRPGFNRPQFLKGLSKCITESGILSYQAAQRWEQVKNDGVKLFHPDKGGTYDVFLQRPLSTILQNYCAEDVVQLPNLLVYYARRISRHLACEVAKEALARVTLSQSPAYQPQGPDKARGPIIKWQSMAPAPDLSFPISVVLSPKLRDYCTINAASAPPPADSQHQKLLEAVTAQAPLYGVDQIT